MNWHAMKLKEVFETLNSSKEGLTQKEAEKRLKKYGKNEIKKTHKLKPIRLFFSQFKSFLIYILIIAIILSILIQAYTDAIVIGIIVIINALIGFFQEYKAEKAIANLKSIIKHNVIVICLFLNNKWFVLFYITMGIIPECFHHPRIFLSDIQVQT